MADKVVGIVSNCVDLRFVDDDFCRDSFDKDEPRQKVKRTKDTT